MRAAGGDSLKEALTAWDASTVDWVLLQNMSHIGDESTFIGGPLKDPRRHSPNECNRIYSALPKLRAQVMRADSVLFDKFNYSMC